MPNKIKTSEKVRSNPFLKGIAHLSPSYFSLAMATGIVSIAAHLYNYQLFSKITLYINIIAYVVLFLMLIARLFLYKKEVLSDFYDGRKNMGFLSFPAASCIVGSQFVLICENDQLGVYFFAIGVASWIFLIYSLFAISIEESEKPSLEGISGSWLLIIVSTQSLSVLAGLLGDKFPMHLDIILFFSFMLFLCGCMFYIIIVTLIFYRLIFLKIQAEKLGANYWISMGADAISVLAGSILILNAEKWPFLAGLLPFLKGFTLFFWAIGTWWIPLITVLGIWRHIVKRIPLKYTFQYWSMVFPLGMYTVCTVMLSQALSLPFLMGIPSVFVLIALGTWTIVFISMVYATGKNILKTA